MVKLTEYPASPCDFYLQITFVRGNAECRETEKGDHLVRKCAVLSVLCRMALRGPICALGGGRAVGLLSSSSPCPGDGGPQLEELCAFLLTCGEADVIRESQSGLDWKES